MLFLVIEIFIFNFCLLVILLVNEIEGGRVYGELWNGKNVGWDCRG